MILVFLLLTIVQILRYVDLFSRVVLVAVAMWFSTLPMSMYLEPHLAFDVWMVSGGVLFGVGSMVIFFSLSVMIDCMEFFDRRWDRDHPDTNPKLIVIYNDNLFFVERRTQ